MKILATTGSGLVLTAVIGGMAGFVAYTSCALGFGLDSQPASLLFPETLRGTAAVSNNVGIHLQGDLAIHMPLKRRIALPLQGTYQASMALDTVIPLKLPIEFKGSIPVDTTIDLDTTTELITQHHWYMPSFPVKGSVPLTFSVPVSLRVPVDTHIRLVYDGPVTMQINQTITSPIDTTLNTTLALNKDIETPIRSTFAIKAYMPQDPVDVLITHSSLETQLKDVKLHANTR